MNFEILFQNYFYYVICSIVRGYLSHYVLKVSYSKVLTVKNLYYLRIDLGIFFTFLLAIHLFQQQSLKLNLMFSHPQSVFL